MAEQKLNFQAEVSKLLEIVVNSLYSEKEIFLRELISNASDACDRLRYAALTEPALNEGGAPFKIVITPDKAAHTLTIADNGIGMNRDELIENLGTIAQVGHLGLPRATLGRRAQGHGADRPVRRRLLFRLHGRREGRCDLAQGRRQPGLALELRRQGRIHRRRGSQRRARRHASFCTCAPAKTNFSIRIGCARSSPPIPITSRFRSRWSKTARRKRSTRPRRLWTRAKNEITDEQYKEFYHHAAHAFDDPWLTIHYRAEGAIEYTGLLFVPSRRPFDLFDPGRKPHLRLYVKRVFITADSEGLLPPYLRFLRGVVDTQDLPLNVSRELLQTNPMLAKMRAGLIKRVLSDLKKKAEDAPEDYLDTFWTNFGAVLKEGIYEDFERRDDILDLCRFASTGSDKPTSLADYVSRMKPGQEAIYTIGGDDIAALRKSPHLEGFVAKGIEVLLLADPIDEFWPQAVTAYKEKPFKSVSQGAADLAKIEGVEDAAKTADAPAADLDALIASLKSTLGDSVKDVRASQRLTESAVCLVSDDGDMSLHLERLLRQHRRDAAAQAARILEINPKHPLIVRLAEAAKTDGNERMADAAWLLLDQARVVEGEAPADPIAFSRRLAAMLARAI